MKISHEPDSWHARGVIRRDFRSGYHPEDEEPTKSRPKGKGKRHCKRSENGEHDWSEYRIEDDYEFIMDEETGKRKRVPIIKRKLYCTNCGKPRYFYSYWGMPYPR